jgi:Mg2+-importing ATPase
MTAAAFGRLTPAQGALLQVAIVVTAYPQRAPGVIVLSDVLDAGNQPSDEVRRLAIPFLEKLSSVFGFVPLSTLQIGAVVAFVLGYIVATEAAKAWFFRSGISVNSPGQ